MLVFVTSCDESNSPLEEEPVNSNAVLINESQYSKESHPHTIESVVIEENRMIVTLSFSGCDDDVSVKLVDNGEVSKASPPERNLKLLVSDAGDCDAAFSKTVTFDLTPTFISGQPNVHFKLEGWDYKLVYQSVPGPENCDDKLLISREKYKKESHPIEIEKVVATENCLEITFTFSGCDDDIDIELIDRGDVGESLPVQRWIKLLVEDAGVCTAVFSVKKSFDMSTVQGINDDAIIFHLEGWDEPFRYDF